MKSLARRFCRPKKPLVHRVRPAAISRWLLLACALSAAAPLRAQLLPLPAPPSVSLPTLPVPALPITAPANLAPLPGLVPAPLSQEVQNLDPQGQRQRANMQKWRRFGDRIDTDINGDLVVRNEIVAWLPSAALLDSVRAQGFAVIRQRALTGLDAVTAVLRPGGGRTAGMSAADGIRRLRELFPDGEFDFNHLYNESGERQAAHKLMNVSAHESAGKSVASSSAAKAPVSARAVVSSAKPATASTAPTHRVGLIDGGVDGSVDSLREVRITRDGCAGREIPSTHGTAVASLMVGKSHKFHGAAPGADLYAADIYCGEPTGGSVDAITGAFAWLAGQGIPVINVSLVGPANKVLEATVRGMIQRGHLIVAAVGNDGPAAPPLYPAAYPGVVGVTAVDAELRVLPEAGRGPQVMFAAPGADMAAARSPSGHIIVRGTSYAAPIVAGLLARLMGAPDRALAQQSLTMLIKTATDLGAPGRNAVSGYGLLGKNMRIDPSQFNLAGTPEKLVMP